MKPIKPFHPQETLGFNDLTLFRNFVTKSVHFLQQSFHLSFRLLLRGFGNVLVFVLFVSSALSVKNAGGQFRILVRHNVSSSWACSKLQKNVTTSHSTKKQPKIQELQRKRRFLQLFFSGTVAVLNLNQGSKVKEVWDPTLLETKDKRWFGTFPNYMSI